MLKKKNHLLQISLHKVHNDIFLKESQGGFYGARYEKGRLWIGDTSLRKYIPNEIEKMINRNKITCGCETCISEMLLQYDLNRWWLRQQV